MFWFRKKSIASKPNYESSLWIERLPGTQIDYQKIAGRLELNSIVAIAIKWLGDRFPRARLVVSEVDRYGMWTPVEPDHDMVKLWYRPNQYYGRRALESSIGLSLIISGNAYVYKLRDTTGRVTELWWLSHDAVEPISRDSKKLITHYRVNSYGLGYVDANDIIHIRDGIDPNNPRKGFSALRSCLREICVVNGEASFNASLLLNGAVPALLVAPNDPSLRPTEDDARTIKARLMEAHSGDNVGGVVVMMGDYRVETIGYSPDQLSLGRLPTAAVSRIAAAIGVAPMTLGLPDPGKTYSNLYEANQTSWGTICSKQELIAEALQNQLLTEPQFASDGRYVVSYDYSEIQELREAVEATHKRARNDYQAGLITRNEAREIIGYDPDPAGDTYVDDQNIYASEQ